MALGSARQHSYHLTSENLGFRLSTVDDLALARELWTDARVMQFMGGPSTEEQVQARLALEMERQRTLGLCYWPIERLLDGSFAGVCGLRPFHGSMQALELGVHMHPRFWGMRFGEEAARAAIESAFGRFGAEKLVAGHGPDHLNSQALIYRLGFRFTHKEPWGDEDILHPFYELIRPK